MQVRELMHFSYTSTFAFDPRICAFRRGGGGHATHQKGPFTGPFW